MRHTTEPIISKLREAEVEMAKGAKVPAVCRNIGVAEPAPRMAEGCAENPYHFCTASENDPFTAL